MLSSLADAWSPRLSFVTREKPSKRRLPGVKIVISARFTTKDGKPPTNIYRCAFNRLFAN
jgi:hypothetical protein